MTLTDVRNRILGCLTGQDTVTLDDLSEIEVPEELQGRRDWVLRAALDDLEKIGIVRFIAADNDGDPNTWMLTAPIGSGGQELAISLPTAIAAAEEINAYIDGTGKDDWPKADALSLHEGNMLMLIAIIADLRSDLPMDGEDDEGEAAS